MRKAAAEHWRRHVDAWRGSGLNQAAYCREHGLNRQSFSRWTRKHPPLAGQAAALTLVPVVIEAAAASPVLNAAAVAINPKPSTANRQLPGRTSQITLRLHGAELVLSTAAPASWLAELLRCLS